MIIGSWELEVRSQETGGSKKLEIENPAISGGICWILQLVVARMDSRFRGNDKVAGMTKLRE